MARMPNLEKLSYTELIELRDEIDGLIAQKKVEEKVALRARFSELARESGFEIHEVLGGKSKKGSTVAIKYRDPDNPSNTWTGRGRMPRWMAAATRKRGVNKEDFLV